MAPGESDSVHFGRNRPESSVSPGATRQRQRGGGRWGSQGGFSPRRSMRQRLMRAQRAVLFGRGTAFPLVQRLPVLLASANSASKRKPSPDERAEPKTNTAKRVSSPPRAGMKSRAGSD